MVLATVPKVMAGDRAAPPKISRPVPLCPCATRLVLLQYMLDLFKKQYMLAKRPAPLGISP